ncbi:MAG: TMEM165/GDT1 family protein [Deltaproteobacteria bacterium]|nr:TMEM165/GDT1 family protein [Deltaproteobacteria bacterium]
MSLRIMMSIFITVFLAEMGDKTQLAAFCYAAEGECSPLGVFLASSAALICSTFLAVLLGSQTSKIIPPHYLKIAAGGGFVIIGLWVLWGAYKGT